MVVLFNRAAYIYEHYYISFTFEYSLNIFNGLGKLSTHHVINATNINKIKNKLN